jgi:hypothetical protein
VIPAASSADSNCAYMKRLICAFAVFTLVVDPSTSTAMMQR